MPRAAHLAVAPQEAAIRLFRKERLSEAEDEQRVHKARKRGE